MADVRLTPEWCEAEARALDEQAAAHRRNATEGGISAAAQRMQGDIAWDCDHRAEAFRLAARALRAREWAERCARDGHGLGSRALAEEIVAILEGREP